MSGNDHDHDHDHDAGGDADERNESYLEVQMDRSTIVLAALGLVVLLAAAFLLGSWFGSRGDDAADEQASTSAATAPGGDDEAGEGDPADHDGEDVPSETGFGGRAVSARGAAPMGAVPPPSRSGAGSARSSAAIPGPSSPILEEELVPAGSRGATAARPKATAARPKATAAKATAAKAAAAEAASGSWYIQVAAVQDRPEAERLAARLKKKGWALRVVEEAGYVKVQVGPYGTKPAAQTAEQRLKREEKLGTWLKKIS